MSSKRTDVTSTVKRVRGIYFTARDLDNNKNKLVAAYRRTTAQVGWLGLRVDSSLALTFIR